MSTLKTCRQRNRLGLPINPAVDGAFEPMSSNVKVFGAIYSAESCSYDAERGVIVVPNRGVRSLLPATGVRLVSFLSFLQKANAALSS